MRSLQVLFFGTVCILIIEAIVGTNGAQGPPGPKGDCGRDGRDGPQGRDGRDGGPGAGPCGGKGCVGDDGTPGRPGVCVACKDVTLDFDTVTTYVRWGKTTCPDSAEEVYEGVMGGNYYNHNGGGSNLLCLPLKPEYGKVTPGADRYRANVYGVEYRMDQKKAPEETLNSLNNYDVPCVVCLARRATTQMVPARDECPSHWTTEYTGYIMAGRYDNPVPSEYICVDKEMEGIEGTSAVKNGGLLYFAEGRCGSLPCTPYVDGNELSCAVCSI